MLPSPEPRTTIIYVTGQVGTIQTTMASHRDVVKLDLMLNMGLFLLENVCSYS